MTVAGGELRCGCFLGEVVSEGDIDVGRGDVTFTQGLCAAVGRLGDCLVPPEEFADCTPDNPDSCTAACVQLDAVRAVDRAATINASLQQTTCDMFCSCDIRAFGGCTEVTIANPEDDDVVLDGTVGNAIVRGPLTTCPDR